MGTILIRASFFFCLFFSALNYESLILLECKKDIAQEQF